MIGGLREIIKEAEEYGLNRELILDRLKRLKKKGWGLVAEQEGIPGPITDYDMGFKDGVEEILGPKVGK